MIDPGWRIVRQDPLVRAWADHARPAALAALDDANNAEWLRCEGTWFVGVDCLTNDAEGRVGQWPPLPWQALGLPPCPLHSGQISAVRPGYPRPVEGESEAAARYRLSQDAAHVDGLLPVGPERRRMLKEPHAWILGLPVTEAAPDAAPLVVWDGSHAIMHRAFQARLCDVPPGEWTKTDVTDTYHAARREVFRTCARRELPLSPGDAVIVHRMTLHGIAPWRAGPGGPRVIVYFRPLVEPEVWLQSDVSSENCAQTTPSASAVTPPRAGASDEASASLTQRSMK